MCSHGVLLLTVLCPALSYWNFFLMYEHLNIILGQKVVSKSHFSKSTHSKHGNSLWYGLSQQGTEGNLYLKNTKKDSMWNRTLNDYGTKTKAVVNIFIKEKKKRLAGFICFLACFLNNNKIYTDLKYLVNIYEDCLMFDLCLI